MANEDPNIPGEVMTPSVGWKLHSAAPVSIVDFGSPSATTDLGLCVYDATGRVLSAGAPAGGTCAGKPCWQATTTRDRYTDQDLTPDGLQTLSLTPGTTGKISAKGKGANLALGALPLMPPLRVQLLRLDSTACWDAVFSSPSTNDATQVRARSD